MPGTNRSAAAAATLRPTCAARVPLAGPTVSALWYPAALDPVSSIPREGPPPLLPPMPMRRPSGPRGMPLPEGDAALWRASPISPCPTPPPSEPCPARRGALPLLSSIPAAATTPTPGGWFPASLSRPLASAVSSWPSCRFRFVAAVAAASSHF
eukprot:2850742-Rhodomonas_salina.1